MRLLAAIAASLSLAAVGLLVSGLWLGSELALRPGWYEHRSPHQGLRPADSFASWAGKTHDPKHDFGWPFETVEFPTDGDATLRGWWIPGSPGARVGIVTVHGAGADRRDFLRHLPVFHEAGYPVLMFDCREHGISDGDSRGVSFGIREHADVIAAVRFARRRGRLERVAVIGTSQGGASVILAAAQDATIDAIVSENPFTDLRALIRDGAATFDPRAARATTVVGWIASLTAWRLGADETHAPIRAIAQIAPRPVLLMHGTADRVIPVAHTHTLRQAAPSAELWIAEGAHHAALFDAAPDQWRRRVLDFLARSVGPALGPSRDEANDETPPRSDERIAPAPSGSAPEAEPSSPAPVVLEEVEVDRDRRSEHQAALPWAPAVGLEGQPIRIRVSEDLAQCAAPLLRNDRPRDTVLAHHRKRPDAPTRCVHAREAAVVLVEQVVLPVQDAKAALDASEPGAIGPLNGERRKEPEERAPEAKQFAAIALDHTDIQRPVRAQKAARQESREAGRHLGNRSQRAAAGVHHLVAIARLEIDHDLGPLLALPNEQLATRLQGLTQCHPSSPPELRVSDYRVQPGGTRCRVSTTWNSRCPRAA